MNIALVIDLVGGLAVPALAAVVARASAARGERQAA